jgi:hypothetical protein
MLRRVAHTDAALGAEDHRHAHLAVGELMVFHAVVDHLVHGDGDEVDVHDFNDGAQAVERAADGAAGHRCFGDGRVADALRAKLFQQAGRRAEEVAPAAHVLADEVDGIVAAQLLGGGIADGVAVAHACHGIQSCPRGIIT